MGKPIRTTYLLTWNPARWNWDDLDECVAKVERTGSHREPWSCGVTKAMRRGERVFLMKLGQEPRGIVASGWVRSRVHKEPHWDSKAPRGKTALYVDIEWDKILDPDKNIFHLAQLQGGVYSKMHWSPQASGVTIPDDVAEQLEKDWAEFLKRPPVDEEVRFPQEVAPGTFPEGATRPVTVNAYERSAEGRKMCIAHHGFLCSVCGFDFEKTYGEIGAGFIEVHHLKPLSSLGKGYRLNPIEDLRPVCPNCHAMLHRKKPVYSIQRLRALVKRHTGQLRGGSRRSGF